MKVFYKKRFDRISTEKRELILDVALEEFAKKGYHAANINTIAEGSNISIGSMYSYFTSKEGLLLTTLYERGAAPARKLYSEVYNSEDDIFIKIEKLLLGVINFSKTNQAVCQVYLDATSEATREMSQKLFEDVQFDASFFWKSLLGRAQEEGIIRRETNVNIASFCLDALVTQLLLSYSTEHYKESLRTYLGDVSLENEDQIARGIVDLFRRGFCY